MRIFKSIIKIVVFIAFGLLVGYLSFKISNKYINNVELKVTFDDHDSFSLENVNKLSKEEALKTWPYIFNIKNVSRRDADYQLIIKDYHGNIKREKLSYIIVIDDQEVVSGKLKDLKDDILYKNKINGNVNQEYKLYVYVSSDLGQIEEASYEYQIELVF